MAPAKPVKRGRGRPAIGPATTIRLSEHHADIARQLGAGDLSAGIRIALDAADAARKRMEARSARGATQPSTGA